MSKVSRALERYSEELQFLWGQWRVALKASDYSRFDLCWLEERINAHVDGILSDEEEATRPYLEQELSADDWRAVFAAAYTLLRMRDENAFTRIMDSFTTAQGGQLNGIREALCHSPIDRCIKQLREAIASAPAPAPIALAAAEVLAFHRKLERPPSRLTELLKDDQPEVRQGAWRVMAMLGSIT